jgi:competence protein ComFC
LLQFILNFLFPPRCASCRREGDFLCKKCIQSFQKKTIRPLSCRDNAWKKDSEFEYLDGLIYALDYAKNPQIQAAIKQFKYKFTQELVLHFQDLLVEKLGELTMIKNRSVLLIPIPLHKRRLNGRGFNQATVIAKAIEKTLTLVTVAEILVRNRHTDQQARLNKTERKNNLKNAFSLNKKYEQNMNKKIVQESIVFLIDDVCTTGSTLESATKVLKENGFKKIHGLVVARAFK